MIDLVRIVDVLRMDLLGEEFMLSFLRLRFEMSMGTGFIITFGFFVGLMFPVESSLELFTISVALLPGASTFYLIVFRRFLRPCYFFILYPYLAISSCASRAFALFSLFF